MHGSLLVTPMWEELEALVAALAAMGHEYVEEEHAKVPVVRFPGLGLCCARGGHGKVQFAVQMQHLLGRFEEVSVAFCVGVAGGLAEQVSVFDVVIAEQTVEHDYRVLFTPRPAPVHVGDAATIARLKRVARQRDFGFGVHFGKIASGDEDIVDVGRAGELHRETGALAVAWEGAGGARACRFCDVPFVEMRAITDAADEHAAGDCDGNLVKSMEHLAAVVAAACA